MKSFKLSLLAMLALTVLSACGSKSENQAPAQVTPTGYGTTYAMPQECRSMNPYMQGQRWQRHQRWGFSTYEWGREERRMRNGRRGPPRRYGQTGCGYGSFAACSPGVGIVCVPSQPYMNTQIALYGYSMGNFNATYMGFGMCGNGGLYAGPQANTLGMVCQTNNPVSCNGLGACQPVAAGSAIGVCVR